VDVVSEPITITTSISSANVIQLDETSGKCSMILKGDANSQISVTSTAVHVSGKYKFFNFKTEVHSDRWFCSPYGEDHLRFLLVVL